jgi:GH43 family beta-xylosidase
MKDPRTLRSPRVRISTPEHDWEKHGWEVNEGPQVLERDGRLFVVYSASGYSTPHYCLGLLENRSGNLLDPKAWQKSPDPIFAAVLDRSPKIYGPGHCAFFKSPDGREDWIIYHARDFEDLRKRPRDVRAQRLRWGADGHPIFGRPLSPGVPSQPPSGE